MCGSRKKEERTQFDKEGKDVLWILLPMSFGAVIAPVGDGGANRSDDGNDDEIPIELCHEALPSSQRAHKKRALAPTVPAIIVTHVPWFGTHGLMTVMNAIPLARSYRNFAELSLCFTFMWTIGLSQVSCIACLWDFKLGIIRAFYLRCV